MGEAFREKKPLERQRDRDRQIKVIDVEMIGQKSSERGRDPNADRSWFTDIKMNEILHTMMLLREYSCPFWATYPLLFH